MQTESIDSSVSGPSSGPASDASSAPPSDAWAVLRRTMVDRQIKTFDVTDAALLARMLDVPRELFLPAELKSLAYSDSSLLLKPGAPGQTPRTLLPPLILARLIQGARVMEGDKALVVAAAGGYSTALVAGLAAEVVALEADPALFEQARASLDAFGLQGVRLLLGPLAAGAASEAPFDVILIDGGVAANLDPLLAQLKNGGRLVTVQRLPDGTGKAVRYDKVDGALGYRILFDAAAPVLDPFKPAEAFTFS
jgi:protein-L-isoaspartate(D-aspartate) O-methyltransferase